MKKIIKIILAILCFFILGNPTKTKADENPYYIDDYQIEAVVHKNATVSVTEHLTVNFNEPRHGIFRDIPVYITKTMVDDNGHTKKMDYANPISDIIVQGAPYEIEYKDNNCSIVIGDKNDTVTGVKEYTISYLLDMGDDRISSYDEFNYNIIGTEWNTVINKANFTIKFDKNIDFTGLKIFSGKYGSTSQDNVTYTAENNTITGYINNPLPSFTGVTVYEKLPQGYYVGARTKSDVPYLVMAVIASISTIMLVFLLIRKKSDINNKVVETIEFYPPDGINSAQVGYIMDGVADDKDMVSLIIWFAHNGYLSIEQDGKHIILHKKQDLPYYKAKYLMDMFNGLFKNGDKVYLSSLESNFINTIITAKKELGNYYSTKQKLFEYKFISVRNIMALIYIISITLTGFFAGPMYKDLGAIIMPFVFTCIPFMVLTCIVNGWAKGSRFNSKFKLILISILVLTVVMLTTFLTIDKTIYSSCYPLVLITEIVAIISLGLYVDETEYKLSMTGRLLGFKTFIEKAELNQINKLVEENPEYYYSVLPYAYVFGLTDKWIKKFEGITLDPPEWFDSGTVFRGFSSYYFIQSLTNDMNSGLNNARQEYQAERDAASGGSDGFSGGGSGGGGGGSW